jgi:hypothetical protein
MIKKENIKGSPKSSALGVVIVLVSIVGFFAMDDIGMTELAIGVVLGAGFLGVKDPRK